MGSQTLLPQTVPVVSATHEVTPWNSPALTSGPIWPSFESFRKLGSGALETIPINAVGTLRTKAGSFRILHDSDFQRVTGIAADVHRLQKGLRIVVHAARVCAKHPDIETVNLLVQSALMVADCPELPVCEGHDVFRPTVHAQLPNQSPEDSDFELTDIPELKW